ncbi:signal peptidase II [Paracoccus sanguinis]|nr:signal peptidase II [Paracoccus sanguinis]
MSDTPTPPAAAGEPAKKPARRRLPAADGTAPKKRRVLKAEPPPLPPRKLWWALGVTLGVLALDQLSKWIVVQALNLKEVQAIDVIDPWLNLRMAWNQGVNFGLFGTDAEFMRWVLIGVALAICVGVAVWLVRLRPGTLAQVAAGLLVGGALGNVIDRVAYGAVADFLNMSLPGWRNPYSFNVADIAIFAGALGLIVQPGPKPAPPPAPAPRPRRRSGSGD